MFKRIKSKKLKVFICLLIAAAVIFAVLSISWLIFVHTQVKPFLKDEGIEKIWSEYGITYYDYRHSDLTTSMYKDDSDVIVGSCVVCSPRFLDFTLSIDVPEISLSDGETGKSMYDYTYTFNYYYTPFKGSKYHMTVNDYTQNEPDMTDTPEGVIVFHSADIVHELIVDKDMKLISGDKEVYDKHYDRLKEQFDVIINFFGEENFK